MTSGGTVPGYLVCPRCGRDCVMDPALPAAAFCTGCAVKVWASLESTYSASHYAGSAPAGTQRLIPSTSRLLLTAPSAVNYVRGSTVMKAARWTGSLVEVLAALTGAGALAASGPPSQSPHTGSPDPAFAARLSDLAAPGPVVVDVIGMRDRSVDVCVGMGPAPDDVTRELADTLASAVTRRGLRAAVDEPFPARSPVTVTAFAQEALHISALQVAVVAWLRDPVSSPTVAKLTVDALASALSSLAA